MSSGGFSQTSPAICPWTWLRDFVPPDLLCPPYPQTLATPCIVHSSTVFQSQIIFFTIKCFFSHSDSWTRKILRVLSMITYLPCKLWVKEKCLTICLLFRHWRLSDCELQERECYFSSLLYLPVVYYWRVVNTGNVDTVSSSHPRSTACVHASL